MLKVKPVSEEMILIVPEGTPTVGCVSDKVGVGGNGLMVAVTADLFKDTQPVSEFLDST
jgi:hypothetical protein